MKIIQRDIDSITVYEKNSREHSADQIQIIANSIKRFGFNQPVVIDENGEIVVGHGRFFAAKKLKLKKIPVLVVDALSDVEKKAYRIADNRAFDCGYYDYESLDAEIAFLQEENFPLEEFSLDFFIRTENLDRNMSEDMVSPSLSENSIMITFESDRDREKLFNELTKRGFQCRLI